MSARSMVMLVAGAGVVGAGLVVLSAGPAYACEEVVTGNGEVSVCPEDETDGAETVPINEPADDWAPPDDWVLSEWSSGGVEEDGLTPCIEHHAQWMHEDDHAGHIASRHYSFFRWYETRTQDGSTVDDCETQPEDSGLPPELVIEAIETQLPLPEPDIRPGWALTGLPAYVEIGAPTSHEDEVTGEQLPVAIEFEAAAEYRVDWGDGTVERHASSGGPYPDGEIHHTYADAVDRTVTVTPIWTISASGNDQTFSFEEIELVSSSVDLPVEELQSVRTSVE